MSDTPTREALAELQQALDASEQEKHFYDALCIDYTAAYLCDLVADTMTIIKRKASSHSAAARQTPEVLQCYSKWIRYSFDHVVIREESPDYLAFFDNHALMARLKAQESFVYRHKTIPNTAGLQYFEARAVRLYADEGCFKIILGYRPIDDIVREEHERQRQLEEALHRAEEASRAKTTFLFNMSHDIRTPMNAIIGYTELLESHCDEPEKRADYLGKIKSSSEYLLCLLNDVLEMARIESGKQTLDETVTDIRDFDKSICAVFENQMAQKNLRFTHTMDVQHHGILCDAVKVKEVLLNILSNACKYTPPGGHIDFAVTELPCDRPGYGLYRSVITDSGIGMSAEFLDTLYDSFTRERTSTESGQNGTGLGMAITKRLVDLMGGTITVESTLGQGTSVSVLISHRLAAPAAGEALPSTLHSVSFAGRRLLLAEDNDLNAEIAAELLQSDDFLVERAADGVECISMLETHPAGYYDLILMDIQMPNMDTTLIREMPSAALAGIPIVAMTANAFAEDKKRALDTGMNAHIAKPIHLQDLEKTIAPLLQ